MRVAVTGAGGRLGRALCRTMSSSGTDVVAWGRAELDVTDATEVAAALSASRPDWVVNCAAWTNVDRCEGDPEGALAVNGRAVETLVAACEANGAGLCHVSTDYVFDGRKGSAYVESDPTAPVNRYGLAKLAGERAAARLERSLIVRVSLVYGDETRPSFVEKIFASAVSGRVFNAAKDMAGAPSFAPELASAIAALLSQDARGLWHAGGAGGATRFELARFAASRIRADAEDLVRPTDQARLKLPAPRPVDSTLDAGRLAREAGVILRPWQETLDGWAEEWLRSHRKPGEAPSGS